MSLKKAKIASEGLIYIGILALLAWISALIGFVPISIIFALLTLSIIYFFRDPDRMTTPDEYALVAPADGKIVDITKVNEEEFLDREMIRIGIFLSIWDVHVNRFPLSGTVLGTKYVKGKFGLAYRDEASRENEKLSTLIETKGKENVVVSQIAGILARRIVSYTKIGDNLGKGERFGMIMFGSRVDLFLPLNSEVTAKVGDHVKGGETIIGWLRDREQ
ncbi:phosphatidylserine decarboxylase family protein [Desulfobacterota bacterium AH_259_B03_O07]|nr:phosphatidylserine decarboxylase family protein [Desulfobacterota bacterium AH_259_B03_O07]